MKLKREDTGEFARIHRRTDRPQRIGLSPRADVQSDTGHVPHPRSGRRRHGTGGKFLNNQDYDPYGVPFQTSTLSLGYTGELTDPNGLVYLRARTYAPRLGVFLTRDPVEGVMERVASRNGYGYVEGNPVNWADPSGECWANSSATPAQQDQCYYAWSIWTALVSDTYTENWPRSVQERVFQLAGYWSKLPYNDFAREWTNPTFSPYSNGSGEEFAPLLGAALAEPTFIGELIAATAFCLLVIRASQTVYLPNRQLSPFLLAESGDPVDAGSLGTEGSAGLPRPSVEDEELAKIIRELFRPEGTVGTGSTADAIREEAITGEPVGGKFHTVKGIHERRRLKAWIRVAKNNFHNPPSDADIDAAEKVLEDLNDALRKAGIRE